MKNIHILHICYIEKFIPSFVELVRNKVKNNIHTFITMGSNYEKYPVKDGKDLTYLPGRYFRYFTIFKRMFTVDKIVLHGLFDPGIILLLFLQPWHLKKCYWVMWGGDIYTPAKKGLLNSIFEFCKKKVAKNIGFLVTYIEGDVKHIRLIYGAQGEYKHCIMYPSNCYKEIQYSCELNSTIDIQIGNSADPENEHLFILEQLRKSSLDKIKIYAPLSYGDKAYAQDVSKLGFKYFDDDFVAIYDFMSVPEYTKWQSSLDIAIFAHKRQQGMGNIITLLGLGKSVYMRSGLSSTLALKKLGLKFGEVDKDKIEIFSSTEMTKNISIIQREFSEKKLIEQLTKIFNS
ncbi:TDP-N-acetylfucosamine:lipid II N-acetylfucosaminyltransferase [Shewanella frigidimarina]|uniref:TDP-N-acetylfucosamine:lipid II N-acetylfucosaminyltransferase n=1 Tax=Shewanella frigidimarina TaxID=56812 RepID=UPI003D7AE2FD